VQEFTDEIDWEDLRIFDRLAEAGTLSAAARSLGVTHATVARRVDRLEGQFGAPLFTRRQAGYRLTALGEALHFQVARMSAAGPAIAALRHEQQALSGTVRISVPRSIADTFLVPNLAAVRDALAGLSLEVITESRVVSIARWETDIAIRLGRSEDSAVVRRKVGAIRYRLFSRDGERLPGFVGYPAEDETTEAAWLRRHAEGRPIVFQSNSQVAQHAAAAAGLGMALLPTFLVRPGDGLELLDDRNFPPDREVALLSRREALRAPPIRRVFDALVELFRLRWEA